MPQEIDINALLGQFSNLTIMVIGDSMIDSYLRGNVDRISPESPVPVVDIRETEHRLGGAANVAANLKAVGVKPILCSVVGQDYESRILKELLTQAGISTTYLIEDPSRQTSVKTRVLRKNHQLIRFDRESTDDLTPSVEKAFIDWILTGIKEQKPDVILFQDYNKGILTPQVISDVLKAANDLQIPVTVDPKRKNFSLYKGVTLFKPNLSEINAALGWDMTGANEEMLRSAAEAIHAMLGNRIILVTLSERGIFYSDGVQSGIQPAQMRIISDVSGAGDTVISIASAALGAGIPLKCLVELANIAGGLVCEEAGVVPVNLVKLKNAASGIHC